MKQVLSIIGRELKTGPRRRRFYLKRTALVGLGGLVLLWGLAMNLLTESTTVGLQVFSSLSFSMLVAMCVISAANAASLVMREKEERTIGLLFLSDISSGAFVWGKLFVSLFSSMMAILSVFPLFMLAISLGGVSAVQILSAFALVLSTSFFVACLGILVAACARTQKGMNGLLVLTCVAWFVFLPVAIMVRAIPSQQEPSMELLSAVSPFVAMGSTVGGSAARWGCLNCCVSLGLGLPLIGLACLILPRRIVSREGAPLRARVKERLKAFRGARRWVVPASIRGNPVQWKDLHFWHGGTRAIWLKFLVSTVCLLAILLAVLLKVGDTSGEDLCVTVVTTLFVYSLAIFGFGSFSSFGMTFHKERRAHALELLLTTSLSRGSILRGKIGAAVSAVFPWLACAGVCAVGLCWIHGYDSDFWEVAFWVSAEYASMWFGYCALALYISLRFTRNAAFGVCVLFFLLWNTLGRMMIAGLAESMMNVEFEEILMLDIGVHMGLGLLCLGRSFGRFRECALADAG